MSLRVALTVLLSACALNALAAENYPSKPIRIIVPYPPGGPSDMQGRLFGAKLDRKSTRLNSSHT